MPQNKHTGLVGGISIFRRGIYFPPGYLFSAGVPILWHNRGVGEGREGTLINYLLRTPAVKRTVLVGEGPLINSNRVAQTIAVIFSVTLY